MTEDPTYRLAVDIGGTFTDVVLESGKTRFSTKVLTTPAEPEKGVLTGVEQVLGQAQAMPQHVDVFLHGTTLATNALIERKGATVGFLTTAGFRDILEMGYEKRFDHYDLMIDAVPPIVPRERRYTVCERMASDGSALAPLDEAALEAIARQMMADGVTAVAIGFLHAYAHPAHELRAAEILRTHLPDRITICQSHQVCPEIREYERFSTTAANAYVRPLMSGYLHRLKAGLAERGLSAPMFLMMSGGGLTTIDTAARFPIRLVESGPAGGAVLAASIAAECGLGEVLSFDMGGTTAKICLISDGVPERARRFEIARTYRNLKGSGWPVRIPVIEMVEIGAGGGSIARIDKLGRIAVGPDSAGSAPGPVSYGRGGTEPTVTDADLTLGKIDPESFAGGAITLDERAAEGALARAIGRPLGIDGAWPAAGVVEIVEEAMAAAARVHAIERGKAIGQCTMIAFGGAAPLHVCRLADKLGIDRIVVPKGAGVGSAIGFLRAPIAFEVTKSSLMPLEPLDISAANELLDSMTATADAVVRPALGKTEPRRTIIADMRYAGQGHEIRVPLPDRPLTEADGQRLRDDFERLYLEIYGLTMPQMSVEIVTWSVTVGADAQRPETVGEAAGQDPIPPKTTRAVFDADAGEIVETPVYWRPDLQPGMRFSGPAIVTERETSTIIGSGFEGQVNALGYLILNRQAEEAKP
ncbi:MAG: hydantoinase/oxoprolinase family protein [Pseudomonadota bacterium]